MPSDESGPSASPDVIQEVVTDGAAEPVETDLEADADLEAGSDGAPVIGEDGDAPAAVKRKTRRGSRGGKNRRKKPAVVADGDDGDRRWRGCGRRRDDRRRAPRKTVNRATVFSELVAPDPVAETALPDEPAVDEAAARATCRCRNGSTISTAGDGARFATLRRLAGACPHFPRQRPHSYELRHHLPRW